MSLRVRSPRRGAPLLGIAFLLLGSPAAAGPPGESDPFALRFEEAAPGILVAIRPDPVRIPVVGNAVMIVDSEDVVVVDASGSPAAARRMIAVLREATPNPVRWLIDTRADPDHTAGNQEFARAFPGVEILGRPGTCEEMLGKVQERIAEIAAGDVESRNAGMAEILRLRRRGAPGDAAIVSHLERYYDGGLDARSEAYRGIQVTPPTFTVEGSMTLYREGRRIEILHPGGSASSDLAVYLPDDRLVVAGDLVTYPIPFGFSREPRRWLEGLRQLSDLDFDVLVPGHGPILEGKEYLGKVVELVAFVVDSVSAALERGEDMEAVRRRLDLSRFRKRFAGEDPILGYRFDTWFTDPVIPRAFVEALERRLGGGG